jgi:hypothetical protein
MRQLFLKVMGALILVNSILLSACSKKEDTITNNPPENPPPVLSRSVQWTLDTLPGRSSGPVTNLFAVVSVENEQQQEILSGKKLAISYNGKYKTEELELPAGTLKVTRFILVNEAGVAQFATPKAGSQKAGLITAALPVSFILPQPVQSAVAMQVLRIQPGDTPESYGYPAGTFNNGTQNPPPGNGNNFIKIKLRAYVQVGDIRYDSIPGTVLYTYWDENQQSFGRYLPLVAGVNEITLSTAALRHHFRFSKWGVDYELALTKQELTEGRLYEIGGTKQAKKLKTELVYTLVNGVYKPETRTTFSYGNNNKLSEINYYAKRQDNSVYLSKKEVFQYAGEQLQQINQFDENSAAAGFISFEYNTSGKISKVVNQDGSGIRTTGIATYHYTPATDMTEVKVRYSYSHNSIIMDYYQRYRQGNMISDNSVTSLNNTENGQYLYDNAINPFAHIGRYDLLFYGRSKNNILDEQKTYFGSYPQAVVYSYTYRYDEEGYPVEVLKNYKSYLTGQHLYTTKTVYTY